ncbi:CapA family protein [Bacillus sp. CGMCC 1.16607]|uniref:CapA family protein n=1 Tax=Bacillus sp. CGMCC 1.16607 TaxID=3351842 RepID=UPI00364165B5
MLKKWKILFVLFILIALPFISLHKAEAQSTTGLEKELQDYIKPWEGKITVHYKNLLSDAEYSLNSKTEVKAASTIKLPLALYIMRLAESGKIDLKEKLTYKSYHYYGGSGVIQKEKVGTQYTIENLVQKSMVYSDNIAFIMLKEKVGQNAFIQFMKSLGASYTYPKGKNHTSAFDLHLYAKAVYDFSQKSSLGKNLIQYLKNTVYNTTIPKGINNVEVAHKVGMIPNEQIYNDIAIVYHPIPYTLAITTKQLPYDKSQQVIANIASIVHRYHQEQKVTISSLNKPVDEKYFITNDKLPIYDNSMGKLVKIGELKANEAFSRIRDYGNWHEIAYGKRKGYVYKKATTMVTLDRSVAFKAEPALGTLKLKVNADVNDNSTKKLIPFAILLKGESIEYTQKMGNWYGVFIGERKGYIYKSAVEVINQPLRLSFAGDAMMDWSVKNTIKHKGADYPLIHVKKELASSDLGIVNLETAITNIENKYPKQYNFKSDPVALTGIKNAGFQLVSLANNHSMDYQTQGFRDTIASLKKYKLDYVGGGLNATEAYSAKTYELKGKKIKILAFSRVLPDYSWVATATKPGLANGYDLSLINSSIKKEKQHADYVFVYIHWGVETNRKPENYQRQWAKSMIDAGADGIVGSHPHVLQGFEYYKGKPIAYSIGNFLFPDYVRGDKAQTGILHLDIINNQIMMSIIPYKIIKDQIVPQSENEKLNVWKELEQLSFGNLKISKGKIAN